MELGPDNVERNEGESYQVEMIYTRGRKEPGLKRESGTDQKIEMTERFAPPWHPTTRVKPVRTSQVLTNPIDKHTAPHAVTIEERKTPRSYLAKEEFQVLDYQND